MKFVETLIFTREVKKLLRDEEYRLLQLALILRPEQGDLIPHARGLRKVRWGIRRRGKRGGIRVIYYWDRKQETFYMLLVFSKSQQEDLTPEQMRILTRLVKEEFK
jgi:mRNA-degrading endonuclease RelE of RelBE toxin-antitoxin system